MLTGIDYSAIARSFAAEVVERGGDERDRFWGDWAETMIAGGAAWLMADHPQDERLISALFDLYTDNEVDYKIATALDTKFDSMNKAARAAFTSYLHLPDREIRPSVLGTTVSHLRLFDSDMIRRLTDTSSMDVGALVRGEPMSLYIIVPPMRLSAYRPILRVWPSCLLLAMTHRAEPTKKER